MDSERWEVKEARRAHRPRPSRARSAFIFAILALTAAFAPLTQAQENLPDWAKPAENEAVRFLREWDARKAENDAEAAAIKREWAQAELLPIDQELAAKAILSRRMDENLEVHKQLNAALKGFAAGLKKNARPIDVQPQQQPPDKNDCLVVATEIYSRLKTTAYWVRIAGFDYTSERNAPGHAVVLYQPMQSSTVWLYDEAGSRDLGIKSHELSELKEAISQWLKSSNARVLDIRWIGEDNTIP